MVGKNGLNLPVTCTTLSVDCGHGTPNTFTNPPHICKQNNFGLGNYFSIKIITFSLSHCTSQDTGIFLEKDCVQCSQPLAEINFSLSIFTSYIQEKLSVLIVKIWQQQIKISDEPTIVNCPNNRTKKTQLMKTTQITKPFIQKLETFF